MASGINKLPTSSEVVVIGCGIIGASVAYHLTKMGCKDVLVVERDEPTSGTTWHSAGLMVTFGHMSETATELRKYSRDLYLNLEIETGQSTGLRQCGFIELVCGTESLEEHRRIAANNRYYGIDVQEISAKEVKELFPIARVDDIDAGFYVEKDGRVNPVDVTMALIKGARQNGAKIINGVSVTGITKKNGTVTGVTTDNGYISCEKVVNCAGMWARQIGEEHGVVIPNQAVEHYYLVTEKMSEVSSEWPVIEDPSHFGYLREEAGGLMVGLFETLAAPWNLDRIPSNFSYGEIEPDWERMTPYLEKALSRVPIAFEYGVRKFFCGPESFTPDRLPAVGEVSDLKNYFVAAGLNSVGILTGGGIGRLVANWVIEGRPDMDVTGISANRFHSYQLTPEYRVDRNRETLGWAYAVHYPTKVPKTARMAKISAIHDRLKKVGASFTDVGGWETPAWFAKVSENAEVGELSWGRMHWWKNWAEEHHACREAVAIFDMSFMAKFRVQGRDAGAVLDYISANCVNEKDGQITYTQWLNENGFIEADLTVIRETAESFLVVTSDTMHMQNLDWLKRNIPADRHAFVTDVTGGLAQINVQGPNSRALLQCLTSVDLSNQAFPFRAARQIDLGLAMVLCNRISYVGELGYELFVNSEHAQGVYDRILEKGSEFGLRHAGIMALRSLRTEKGYRDYGHDIDNLDTPYDVGLGFAVKLKKPNGFLGLDSIKSIKEAAHLQRRQLVQIFVEDPEPLLWHGEIVLRDAVPVGTVRSASYGHTLGGAVGLAMIERSDIGPLNEDYLQSGNWTVDIAGKQYSCRCSLSPLYDPKMQRIKR